MVQQYYDENVKEALSSKNRLIPFSLYQEPEEYNIDAIDRYSNDVARNAVASMFVGNPDQLDKDMEGILHNLAADVEEKNQVLAEFIRSYKLNPEQAQDLLITLMDAEDGEE